MKYFSKKFDPDFLWKDIFKGAKIQGLNEE